MDERKFHFHRFNILCLHELSTKIAILVVYNLPKVFMYKKKLNHLIRRLLLISQHGNWPNVDANAF